MHYSLRSWYEFMWLCSCLLRFQSFSLLSQFVFHWLNRLPLLLRRIEGFQNCRHFLCVGALLLISRVLWITFGRGFGFASVAVLLLVFLWLNILVCHNAHDLPVIIQDWQSREFFWIFEEQLVIVYFSLKFVACGAKSSSWCSFWDANFIRIGCVVVERGSSELACEKFWFGHLGFLLVFCVFIRALRNAVVLAYVWNRVSCLRVGCRDKHLFRKQFAKVHTLCISEQHPISYLCIDGWVIYQWLMVFLSNSINLDNRWCRVIGLASVIEEREPSFDLVVSKCEFITYSAV